MTKTQGDQNLTNFSAEITNDESNYIKAVKQIPVLHTVGPQYTWTAAVP